MSAEPERGSIGCYDGCGASTTPDAVESSGWTWLPISQRYRCPACWRALNALNTPSTSSQEQP